MLNKSDEVPKLEFFTKDEQIKFLNLRIEALEKRVKILENEKTKKEI
jgi:hypothetical protein